MGSLRDYWRSHVNVDCAFHHTFERSAITEWIRRGNTTCPLDREHLFSDLLVTNIHLRDAVESLFINDELDPEEDTVKAI
jgi:hypothetical protein